MNPDRPTRLHYAWIIVAVACLVVFASLGLARFGYGVVLPAMQERPAHRAHRIEERL